MRIDINRLTTMARTGAAFVQANPVQIIALAALVGGGYVATKNKNKIVKLLGVGVAAIAAINLAQTKAIQEEALRVVKNHPIAAAGIAVALATPEGRAVARQIAQHPKLVAGAALVYNMRNTKPMQAVLKMAKAHPVVAAAVAVSAVVAATPQARKAVAHVAKEIAKPIQATFDRYAVEVEQEQEYGLAESEESTGGFFSSFFSGFGSSEEAGSLF